METRYTMLLPLVENIQDNMPLAATVSSPIEFLEQINKAEEAGQKLQTKEL